MLIEFSVGNYLSFKDKVTFSMVTTDLDSNPRLDENNVFQVDDELSLLKSAAVYGANASGKSNLVKAIAFMRRFILDSSSRTQITDLININKFKLSTETTNKPSFFEIVFMLNKKIYRYGFKLNKKEVISEWLCYTPISQEYKYFERNKQNFKIRKKFSEGISIDSKTRPNALFLSVVAQFNGNVSKQILLWFESIGILSGIRSNLSNAYTLRLINNTIYKKKIIELIKKLDLNINDIKTRRKNINIEDFVQGIFEIADRRDREIINPGEEKVSLNISFDIKTIHNKYDSEGNIYSTEEFDLDENESEGTKKLFALAGYILFILNKGSILIIDELDARLHPLITKTIVELFNSKETNYNNAQLIFMTHDTNLLTNKLFRRDQIWFTEKDQYEVTDLYSLVEYDISDKDLYESDYIKGRYGAIPFIGDIRSLIIDENGKA